MLHVGRLEHLMGAAPRRSAESPADQAAHPHDGRAHRVRPWWSEIDVLGGVAWFVGATMVASIVTMVAPIMGGGESVDATPVYGLFFGGLTFQVLVATYPWLISRWKGLGITLDWRLLPLRAADFKVGPLLAVCCFVGAQVATVVVAVLVGLENPDDASNSGVLTDSRGSMWLIGMIGLVVVGAPLAEELLFRGLMLRVLEKSFGSVFAVVVSSLLFALPHWQAAASWQEATVLLSAITVVGLVLAVGAVATGRLGPSIMAHFLFNLVGTISALAL